MVPYLYIVIVNVIVNEKSRLIKGRLSIMTWQKVG
jgi:hypothetical protein